MYTKLSEGFENQSKFLSPTLDAQTVAEAIFEKVLRGQSGFVVLPRTHEWLACSIRALPFWVQDYLRGELKGVMLGVEALWKKREMEMKKALEGGKEKLVEGKERVEEGFKEGKERVEEGFKEGNEKVREEVEETVDKAGDSFVQVAE